MKCPMPFYVRAFYAGVFSFAGGFMIGYAPENDSLACIMMNVAGAIFVCISAVWMKTLDEGK